MGNSENNNNRKGLTKEGKCIFCEIIQNKSQEIYELPPPYNNT